MTDIGAYIIEPYLAVEFKRVADKYGQCCRSPLRLHYTTSDVALAERAIDRKRYKVIGLDAECVKVDMLVDALTAKAGRLGIVDALAYIKREGARK